MIYDLGDLRETGDARRKRALRKQRLVTLVQAVACSAGLAWTALLVRALLQRAGR